MKVLSAWLIASSLTIAVLGAAPVAARADEARDTADGATDGSIVPAQPGVVQQYCTNIRDAAADARIAWQTKALSEIGEQVEARIAALNEQQAKFEEWLQRREAFLAKARENLVAVYANMRPDAAASQLSIIDADTAAAVLSSLQPRVASAIMNEMEPRRAAQLVLAMAGPVEEPEAVVSR